MNTEMNSQVVEALKQKLIAKGETYGQGLGAAYALGYLASMLQELMQDPKIKTEVEAALAHIS